MIYISAWASSMPMKTGKIEIDGISSSWYRCIISGKKLLKKVKMILDYWQLRHGRRLMFKGYACAHTRVKPVIKSFLRKRFEKQLKYVYSYFLPKTENNSKKAVFFDKASRRNNNSTSTQPLLGVINWIIFIPTHTQIAVWIVDEKLFVFYRVI